MIWAIVGLSLVVAGLVYHAVIATKRHTKVIEVVNSHSEHLNAFGEVMGNMKGIVDQAQGMEPQMVEMTQEQYDEFEMTGELPEGLIQEKKKPTLH